MSVSCPAGRQTQAAYICSHDTSHIVPYARQSDATSARSLKNMMKKRPDRYVSGQIKYYHKQTAPPAADKKQPGSSENTSETKNL